MRGRGGRFGRGRGPEAAQAAWPGPGAAAGELSPVESFLEVLRLALAARGAQVWRLEGEGWECEREAAGDPEAGPERLPAAAHPFTWALREGLQLQVRAEELFGQGGGWCLCGGPAGSGRVLCVRFEGTPGGVARPALGAALAHLRALYRRETASRASSPGGRRPPD